MFEAENRRFSMLVLSSLAISALVFSGLFNEDPGFPCSSPKQGI